MGEIIIGTMQTVCSGLLRVHTVTQTYCKTMVMMMTAVRKTMTIALMTTITMMITSKDIAMHWRISNGDGELRYFPKAKCVGVHKH